LDANIFINASNQESICSAITYREYQKKFRVICSNAMLEELIYVYRYEIAPTQKPEQVAETLYRWMRLFRRCKPIETTIRLDLIKDDPSDNMYLECATESNAQYIVTYNYKHFNGVKGKVFNNKGESVTICDGKEFLDILDEIKNGKEVSGA
jgi:predicted nucleic acid-binding protein